MAPKDNAFVALRTPRDGETTLVDEGKEESTGESPANSSVGSKGPVSAPTLKDVSLWDLYRFATPLDIALLFVGCIAACINGVLYPCMALVFGHAISAFDPFDADAVNRAAMEYFFIAIALFVSDFFTCATFGAMSERQVRVLRETALRHLLHLDLAWYDAHSDSVLQLSSRITGDTVKIKNGMGQKLGDGIKYTAQFLCGYAIGFAQSWDMALVMSCVTPLTVYSMSYLLGMLRTYAARSQQVYAEAGAIAEETLGSMRTVASLNGEHRAVERYDAKTKIVEEANIELFRRAGFVQGIFSSSVWLMYAVGLWYGGRKVYTSKLSPGTVFQAFFGVVMGTWSLGQISPNISAIAEARGAAAGIFTILDTPPNIHPPRSGATVPNSCQGHVSFSEVYFAYPCRPNATVIRNFSVHIAAGQTVAFVGPSGGGKSTIVSLLERFYDPQSGSVLLDGRDIRSLNVKWLRAQIGLVSQEPVLFATTVFENIAIGIPLDRPVVMEDVVAAAKLANAHDFIMHLPQQYDTFVGEKGVSLSGGQKQRIAIARAMVREPKILVLDEATSALDNESERAVQSALNRLMWTRTQMTTLVIAHRLSTIRSADKIVVMLDGCVVEEGSHEELTKLGDGIFQKMLSAQLTDWPATTESGLDDRTAIQLCQEKVAKAADFVSVNTHGAGEEYRRSERPRSKFTMADAMKLSAPETSFYSLGMVAAMMHGLSLPASALLISQVVNVMTDRYAHYQITTDSRFLKQLSVEVQRYGLWYLLVAFIVGCAHWAQVYCFRVMAEKLTARLRRLHFLSLCRQDMAFFDHTKHATGALTSALAIQALKASLVSGDAQGRMVQAATTLATAILVAFLAGSWVLTLVMLSILPFILAGEVIRNKQMKGVLLYSDELSDAGSHASQALSNVRTIKAFGLERQMCNAFSKTLEEPMQKGMRESKINGLAIGYSSFIVFATYASIFWYGGSLVSRGEISFKELIHTLMAIIMASQGVGFAASWLGESAHALKAGTEIFKIRDRPHTIDALRDDEGRRLDHVDGHIEFRHVTFEYPTRPTITVLDKMDLVIGAKQTVGLCGTSGGGKSTIVALIERFYDPAGGLVTLDGHDLKTLNVQWLRRQMGYVGQEPTLFIGTIAENIAYGLDYEPSLEQIERVAKLANAHEFVSNLPDGYATQVGARGELLSGGQKQRIAIARAILREPRVLILDEATSALDSASERVVQAALDGVVAEHRCTTLIIAHRLSTLRYADKICVVDNGRVVEEGPHEELVQLGGAYAKLLSCGNNEEQGGLV